MTGKHFPQDLPVQVHPFATDRPIDGRAEDLLCRTCFSDAIADSIGSWRHNDSLIIALYGQWGSGKSSIKNMVVERFKVKGENSPIVVEFNPWHWSGEDQILEAFFQEVAKGIDAFDKEAQAKEIARKWRQYGAYLKPPLTVAEALAAFVPVLGQALKSVNATVDAATEMFESRAQAFPKSLGEQKDELKALFNGLERPLVVVLDDVDRLAPDEIRLLFRLVKANADFPNVVYLMLFQRDIVERALSSSENTADGQEYLEKIIQVGFDIPLVERTRLEKVLFEGIDRILDGVAGLQPFDQRRWGNIYIPGLSVFFQSLRDVRRFLSVFAFHVNLFQGEHAFEVNVIDLIALEALRVFEPDVYARIVQTKHALTERRPGGIYDSDEAKEELGKEIRALVERSSEQHRESVQRVISQLFPLACWVFGGPTYGGDFDEEWYRALRVCHLQVFDRFFHLAIPSGDVSHSDIQRLISLAGDRENLVAEFRSLEARGLLPAMLNRLESYKQEIDIAHAVPFITAIMDIGDDLPDDRSIYTCMGSDMHATRIVLWYLRQEPDKSRRAAVLRSAINATTGLYIAADRIAYESEEKDDREPEFWLIERNEVKAFQELVVQKIETAAKDGNLTQNRRLHFLLWRWSEWAGEEAPGAWVQAQIKSDPGLLAVLVAFTSKVSSHGAGDYVAKQRWQASLQSLEYFVSLDIIEKRLTEVSREGLSAEQERAVQAFEQAFRRKKDGKPNDGWPLDDDD